MLQSCKNMLGYHIEANDGAIGKIHDFFFDDHLWTIRYAVVDTSRWLPGRKVLLSPDACAETVGETRVMHVDLTREQIKNSPDVRTDEPVSRQEEEKLRMHYGWSPYWPMATFAPAVSDYGQLDPLPVSGPDTSEKTDSQKPSLRSLREVSHYHVNAIDGDVGRSEDMIMDDEDWRLRYLVVDTGHWLSSRKVLISLGWIQEISWSGSKVVVDVDRKAIENSPPFDPGRPVNREYEVLLYDYYGRPCYWVRAK